MNPDRFDSTRLAGLTDKLPSLDTTQWGKLGAGVGLVLAGTGLASVGTLLRLAVVAGGGVLAYRTWTEAAGQGAPAGASSAMATAGVSPSTTGQRGSSATQEPLTTGDTLASGNDENSPPGASDLTDVPAVDMSGA